MVTSLRPMYVLHSYMEPWDVGFADGASGPRASKVCNEGVITIMQLLLQQYYDHYVSLYVLYH